MAQIPFEDLMEHVDSKYRLVMIASKRAKQLNRGAQSLLAPKSVKPTYQALEEVAGGKMGYEIEPLEGAMARELAEAGGKASWYRSLSAEEVAPDEVVVEAEETVEEEEEAPVTPPVTTGTEDLLINEFVEEGLDELEIEPVDGEETEE